VKVFREVGSQVVDGKRAKRKVHYSSCLSTATVLEVERKSNRLGNQCCRRHETGLHPALSTAADEETERKSLGKQAGKSTRRLSGEIASAPLRPAQALCRAVALQPPRLIGHLLRDDSPVIFVLVVEGELDARGNVLLGEEGEVVDLLVRMID